MDAFLYAVAEVKDIEGIDALSLALDKIEAQVGLVTEPVRLVDVRGAIDVRKGILAGEASAAKCANFEDS